MTPIGIKLTLDGQREVSQGLKQVGNDVNSLGSAGGKLGGLSQGMDKAALSAGQLRMATQQLPLQFQDIVVSLQAGQQPLTVFLQQGSQIAGSFGGAAAAAKAMAGYVVGLINPLTLAGAAVAVLGAAYYQGSKEQDAWIKGIVTTGNASGVTTSQLREYARQMDDVAGTQARAAAGLADFVSAGVRGGDELRRYTEAAVMWEKATGQAVSTTAKQFADLQKDPLQGVIKLNEGTNFLTVSVYEQIKALEAQGDKAGAARVAMDALDSATRERAKEIENSLGYIEIAWNGIASAAKKGWDAMLNVGRSQTVDEKLVEARQKLDAMQSEAPGVYERGTHEVRLKRQRELVASLEAESAAQALNAAAKSHSAQQTQALLAFDNKYSKALESEISLQDKLNRTRAEAVAAGKGEADIKKVLAYVTEEHNKSLGNGASAAKQAKTSYETLLSAINQKIVAMQSEAVAGEKLTETEKLRAKLQEELSTKGRQYSAQQRADLEARLLVLDVVEQQAIAAKTLAKANEDDAKALERLTNQRENALRTLQQSVVAAQDEERAAAMAAASNISTAEAVALLAQARSEDAYQQAVANGEAPQTLYFLEQEMAARRKLAEVMGQRTVREANEKAAKEMAREWERVSRTVGDTLADYIMAGGKDAATYLKRLFATLVLQPVVQTVVGGVLGTGVAGASGVASGGGASGLVNLAQQAYGALTSPIFSNFGMGMAGNIQQLGGTLFSKGFESLGSGFVDFGNTVAQFSDAINIAGDVFGYGSALYSLSKGNYGSALGTAVGTYFGGPVGAMLGSTLGGLLDGALGGFSSRGANHVGGTYSSQGLNDRQVAIALGLPAGGNKAGDLYKRSNAALDKSLAGLAGGLLGVYNGLIEQTGGNKLGINAGFAINPKYDDEESYGYFRIIDEVTGKVLAKYDNRDLSSNHDKAWQQYSSAMAGAFVGQLKQADIPGWMRDVLDGLGGAITTEGFAQAAQQIALMDSAFKSWAVNVDGFDGLAASVQTTLVRTAGGFDALAASVEGYYQNFYTEQERAAKSAVQMSEVLAEYGVELPATTEQYRALVEQQLAAGDAGAELAAVLLGMQGSFKSAADVWQKELADLVGSVDSFFGGLQSAIDSLSADVAADRKSIVRGSNVMSAADIAAGIAGALVNRPSMDSLGGAAAVSLAAGEGFAEAKTAIEAAQKALQDAQAKRDGATSARDSVASQIAAANDRLAYLQWDSSQLWGDGSKSGHSLSKRKRWQRDIDAAMASQLSQRDQLERQLEPLVQAAAQQQAAYDAVAASAAGAAEQLAAAQQALAVAQAAEMQAKVDYAAEMNQFVIDAGNSVDKLGDLRGEVMSFYEAQAQAVQAMLQSAGNLRGVVDQLRLGQLTTAQTAAELGSRYAADYSMALSTTGSVRAGYVDGMAANLSGLTQALQAEAATSEDWRIQTAKLFAQASNAAGLLEGDASSDSYQDVTLELLDSIDAALADLSGIAQSAEDMIVEAINTGSSGNLEGLRAIVAALKGETIPAFATGGWHTGGMRLVGENGPELEVTGPARYWNASQTAAMFGGGGGAEVLAEMRALRQENQQLRQEAQAHALAGLDLQEQVYVLMKRWDQQGAPNARPAEMEQA